MKNKTIILIIVLLISFNNICYAEDLKELRIDKEGMNPQFEKDIYEYYLTVSNDTHDLEVTAISENSNDDIKITGNKNLKEGLNKINVQVISEDKKQEKIYTIEVTKTANAELANTNLETLEIENTLLNPPFSIDETKYKTEISNEQDSINILAIPQNEKARVKITGKDNLKVGNNLVTIVVTAPNGFTKKKYQINVKRRNTEEEVEYKKEEEMQKEQIQQAYEAEKLSTDYQKQNKPKNETANNTKYKIIGIIIVGIAIGIVVLSLLIFKSKE